MTLYRRIIKYLLLFLLLAISYPAMIAQDVVRPPEQDKRLKQEFRHPHERLRDINNNPDHFAYVPEEAYRKEEIEDVQAFAQMQRRYSSSKFDYTEEEYDYTRETWLRRLSYAVESFFERLFDSFGLVFKLNKTIVNILIIVFLSIFLFFIGRMILAGRWKARNIHEGNNSDLPEVLEKNLLNVDLNIRLEEALESGDYMQAIRYLHLINLRKLAIHRLIQWNYKKTNRELLLEIEDRTLNSQFATTIKIYEYIWYGKFALSEKKYREYETLFHQFNKQIA